MAYIILPLDCFIRMELSNFIETSPMKIIKTECVRIKKGSNPRWKRTFHILYIRCWSLNPKPQLKNQLIGAIEKPSIRVGVTKSVSRIDS